MNSNEYLVQILNKYSAKDLTSYSYDISNLKSLLRSWASSCYLDILDSGSRAKGTAICLASDVDYLVSLSNCCNENSGGLGSIYNSLYEKLTSKYYNVRKQNVSFRINIRGLEVDVTPGRKYSGNSNYHSLFVSKRNTWQQTNIQTHINDVSQSGRLNEIKLLKIWRELHNLSFPSVYMEYLVIKNILSGRSTNSSYLADNFLHILSELSKNIGNPLYSRIVDPSNTNNVLSDLLTSTEKLNIFNQAKASFNQQYWRNILW
jgi:hypothetical protein